MIRFDALHEVLDRAKKISETKAWFYAFDLKTKQYVITLNTHEQLGDEGIDAKGRSLGDYAPFTVEFRKSKGLQVDHIDFKVTGQYWASWKVEVKRDSFEITVDEDRFNELVQELRFSPDHVGLTPESMEKLIGVIRNKYIEYVKGELLH